MNQTSSTCSPEQQLALYNFLKSFVAQLQMSCKDRAILVRLRFKTCNFVFHSDDSHNSRLVPPASFFWTPRTEMVQSMFSAASCKDAVHCILFSVGQENDPSNQEALQMKVLNEGEPGSLRAPLGGILL